MYDADYESWMQEQNDQAVGEYLRANFGVKNTEQKYTERIDEDTTVTVTGQPPELLKFSVKDSGEKSKYDDGMQRDTSVGKPQFALLFPKDVPYEDQLMTRVAALYHSGGVKYGPRNWEKSNSEESLAHHEEALMRHVVRFLLGVDDGEDHGAAVVWNVNAVDLTRRKIREKKEVHAQAFGGEYEDGITTVGEAGKCDCLAGACTCEKKETEQAKSDAEFIAKTNAAVTPSARPTRVEYLYFNTGDELLDTYGHRWTFRSKLGEGSSWKSDSPGGYTARIGDLAKHSGPLTTQNGYTGLTILKDGSLKWD